MLSCDCKSLRWLLMGLSCRESLVEELQASLCAEDDCLAGQGFDVTSLHVWRTPAGATEAWEHVKEIPLV